MANINGNNRDDVLVGGPGGDLIRGRGGNDDIGGGAGDDRLKGDDGNDRITDGAGADDMWGGSGADTFVLVRDGDADRIRDWEAGDRIDLSEWGVRDLSELTITQLSNGDLQIVHGTEILEIEGMGGADLAPGDLQAPDFVFAPTPVYRTLDLESLDQNLVPNGAPIEYIDAGHGGLTWSDQFYFAEHDEMQQRGVISGIDNRTSSGDNVAINGHAEDVSFSAAADFDFEQMVVGAVWNEGLVLTVTGYDDGVATGSQTFVLSTQSSQVVDLDDAIFNKVDEVKFSTAGGTLHADYAGQQIGGDLTHFYIDDLVIG